MFKNQTITTIAAQAPTPTPSPLPKILQEVSFVEVLTVVTALATLLGAIWRLSTLYNKINYQIQDVFSKFADTKKDFQLIHDKFENVHKKLSDDVRANELLFREKLEKLDDDIAEIKTKQKSLYGTVERLAQELKQAGIYNFTMGRE